MVSTIIELEVLGGIPVELEVFSSPADPSTGTLESIVDEWKVTAVGSIASALILDLVEAQMHAVLDHNALKALILKEMKNV